MGSAVNHPTKEERQAAKAAIAESARVEFLIGMMNARAEQLGGREYLPAIASEAFELAEEVQRLQRINRVLVTKHNALLDSLREVPEDRVEQRQFRPRRLV